MNIRPNKYYIFIADGYSVIYKNIGRKTAIDGPLYHFIDLIEYNSKWNKDTKINRDVIYEGSPMDEHSIEIDEDKIEFYRHLYF